MFIKELNIYIEFLKDKVNDASRNPVEKEQKYLLSFSENLEQGIEYYSNLFKEKSDSFNESYELLMNNLEDSFQRLKLLKLRISNLMLFKMTKTENVKQSSHNGTKFKESIFTHKSNSLVN
jgi:molecular chaperone GrpE (heat shock protein)